MPRSNRLREDAAERGLVYDPATRGAFLPGVPSVRFSRRQFDRMRDQPAPYSVLEDARTVGTYMRTRMRPGGGAGRERERDALRADPTAVLGDKNLQASIAVLRWDAQQPGDRRSDREAQAFAWALRRIHGKRSIDWTRYRGRR